MMRTPFLLLAFLLISPSLMGQPALKNEVHLAEILSYSKENSVNKDSVDWPTLESEVKAIHKNEGLIHATQHLLKNLKDFHGRIWYEMIPYNGLIKDGVGSVVKLDSAMREQYRYTTIPIESSILNNEIGYIRIPGLASGPNDSINAHNINNRILEMARSSNIKGWIVDLRVNGGGTMYPMLSGLAALLGNGPVGSFIDRASDYKESWTIKEGDVYVDTFKVSDYGITDLMDLSNEKVVVITSGRTMSSGEVVALAFRNRPNTTTIGEATGGYTTTVSWNQLDEQTVFQLTVSWYADRLDNTFKGESIPPDLEFTGVVNLNDPSKDEWVAKAVEMLTK